GGRPMSNIDKRALREAAEKAGADEWCAFIDTKSKTYSVHTPGDNRCGDVVKWAGFDGQKRAAAKAKFIAAANPATVLALLDELEAAERRIAELEAIAKSVKFDPIPMEDLGNKSDGKKHPYMFGAGYNSAVVHCESVLLQAFAAAAGKGEAS
ncbi:ead/Ea22-like family protein, partial [Enterobacter hormaechei]|uniref:ead/Ea22-like family protein n=2 Tax=Enterobacter hormaechei TaxID=158836 RepID=UPI0031384842